MLVCAVIKNIRLTVGICVGGRVAASFSFASDGRRTADEYAMLIEAAALRHGITMGDCEGVIIGSVFPALTGVVGEALTALTGKTPLIVGPGVKSGLDIRIEQHTQLGADIVANAAAAQTLVKPPYIAADLDDSVTLTAVNEKGELCGVVIAAGAGSSLRALSDNAELPLIELHKPDSILGRNTAASMNAGILYGCAAMCDGLCERIKEELGCAEINVAATGIYAPLILPLMKTNADFYADLTLRGLAAIYENDRRKRKA